MIRAPRNSSTAPSFRVSTTRSQEAEPSPEAQRLGLDAYASDLNPVAVLINKAMIEIPPRFAGRAPVCPGAAQGLATAGAWIGARGLAEDVRYYGEWLRNEAERRIGRHYPLMEVTPAIAKTRKDLSKRVGEKLTVIGWRWRVRKEFLTRRSRTWTFRLSLRSCCLRRLAWKPTWKLGLQGPIYCLSDYHGSEANPDRHRRAGLPETDSRRGRLVSHHTFGNLVWRGLYQS